MITLKVYVSDNCWACEETHRVIAEVSPQFPDVKVEMVFLSDLRCPAEVFAVPTYLLNGRIIFLGNPTCGELIQTLVKARVNGNA